MVEVLYQLIDQFQPQCEQEVTDRKIMLEVLETQDDCLLRSNLTGHFTVSAWIVDPERMRTVLVYHNIYNSWSWVGGHADGIADLAAVAMRETVEETGLSNIRLVGKCPISIEILAVNGHEKKNVYVPSHLHYNVTYLLEADSSAILSVKPDENSAVGWFRFDEIENVSSEPWFVERVYRKLTERCKCHE